ncbi:helix-turn-helix transcriptional regulator [Paenibacillus sp. S150]|uniref:ArsR/SmtB family transcription factor n=1 Tax=Paenibacillus sp. S150 TaxID=2749826 RepID=UPI001C563739|nr:metalloregulator ArsR/SmtB family transcription factor [Paenibacillus sp. S150]MBW4085424.1 winged helix-turn-helix transcriptional regulator [Paenibacillus sp. S150]
MKEEAREPESPETKTAAGAESALLHKKQVFLNELRKSTDLFKAVADPVRQDILMMFMVAKRLNVSQIVERSPMSRPTISHHLKILKQAGIVNSRKEATEVHYWLTMESSILDQLRSIIRAAEEIENDEAKPYDTGE